MNKQEQLRQDIGDLLSLVRLQNLYTLHYFFADDVDDFYNNTNRYVAIMKSGKHVDKRIFNQILSKIRATNKFCSIDRPNLQNIFNHPHQKVCFKYKEIVERLVADNEILVFGHGSLKTKAMDEAEHYANRYFIPKFTLQNWLTNYDSIEEAFKDEKTKASKRVLARFEKLVSNEDNPTDNLDKIIQLLESTTKMKITQAQETAIQRRLQLIDKFVSEIKGMFDGKAPEEVSTFSEKTLDDIEKKKDALNNPKKIASPKQQAKVDFMDALPKDKGEELDFDLYRPTNKWVAELQAKLKELVGRNPGLAPSFANKVCEVFGFTPFEKQQTFTGEIGKCDYALQTKLHSTIVAAYNERKFTLNEVMDRKKLDELISTWKAKE